MQMKMMKQMECDREQKEKTIKDQILLNTFINVVKYIITNNEYTLST